MSPQRAAAVAGLLAVSPWVLCSSTMIFANKAVYVAGFRFPFMMTCVGQLASCALGLLLIALRVFPYRPLPPLATCARAVLPGAAMMAATLYTGNAAYLTLSVAFIQMVKGFTPCMTLLIAAALGKEVVSAELVAAVLLTGAGTMVSAAVEGGSPAFHAAGFALMTLSCLTEAFRAVLVQHMHSTRPGGYNLAETMVVVSLPAGLCLGAMSLLFELPGLWDEGVPVVQQHGGTIAAAIALSCLTNLTGYAAIQRTSSLTFKVVGAGKNIGVLAISNMRGDRVTPLQALAYAISLGGTFYYSVIRSRSVPSTGPKHKKGPQD